MEDQLRHKLCRPCDTSLTATLAVSILSMTWGPPISWSSHQESWKSVH